MKIAIVYSSLTGNTLKLAEVIKTECKDVEYFGKPNDLNLDCDLYFYWFLD